jgi:hypothetical protein
VPTRDILRPRKLSRRELLTDLAALSACGVPIAGGLSLQHSVAGRQATQAAPLASQLPPPTYLSPRDDSFLEELEKAIFQFFWDQTKPSTGMMKDRCNVRSSDSGVVGSIAATGFGLTALCIGEKRGYVSFTLARERVINALRFLWKKLPTQRGFFYHWANINTGERLWQSEFSSIDTSILLCGILTCRAHFEHSEISDLAHQIFNRVDWNWLSEDTRILPHGWSPETGFLQYRWDSYSEMMMMYLLGLGSTSHALAPATWDAWKRSIFEFDGIKFIGSYAPLFVH